MPDSSARKDQVVRHRGPNTKAGCQTCKIRRKRCDQTRPACCRCSSTGRTCDFLSNTSTKVPILHENESISCTMTTSESFTVSPALSLLQLGNSIEADHFDYFLSKCTKEFSASFNALLWERLVVQAAYREPFILHAVLAISSLRRMQVETTDPISLGNLAITDYVTKKYTIALQTFRQRLQDRAVDWRLAALGSLVLLAIEVLLGHEQGALIHFRSGEMILKSLSTNNITHKTGKESKTILSQADYRHDAVSDDIVTAFTRLDVQQELFIGVSSSNSVDIPNLPEYFDTINDARSALNSIMAAAISFLRRNGDETLKTLPLIALPQTILAELAPLQHTLNTWYLLFTKMLSQLPTLEVPFQAIANILLVHYHTTSLQLSTFFFASELIYDQHTSLFITIFNIFSFIISHLNENQNSSHNHISKGPCYVLDIAIVQPLYFIARKCRNWDLRMRAIEEMKKVGIWGVYTGAAVARVAEWVVGMEVGEHGCGEFVEDDRRLRDVRFEVDWERRLGKVWGMRIRWDGEREYLGGDLDLS